MGPNQFSSGQVLPSNGDIYGTFDWTLAVTGSDPSFRLLVGCFN